MEAEAVVSAVEVEVEFAVEFVEEFAVMDEAVRLDEANNSLAASVACWVVEFAATAVADSV